MAHRIPHARVLTTALLGVAASLAVVAPAHGQAVTTATPNQAGAGTRLHWAVDGTVDPVARRIPSALTMSAPPGFGYDLAAVPVRCKPLDARLDECPAKSRIGSALMTIRVFKPAGPADLPIDIKLYQGQGDQLMAVAFLAGVRVVPGRIDTSNGIQVIFDPLPVPPVIPEVSYEFVGVTVDLGVTRRVAVPGEKAKGRKGKQRRPRRTTRVDLVQTPATCPAGGWATTAMLAFPDGSTTLMDAPAACSG